MPDQTIDAIKVKLGVDAADIKNQVSAANTALDALGSSTSKRVVKVELQTTLQQGGSEAIKRLEFLGNKGVTVSVGVKFRNTGEDSIAAMRRSITKGFAATGGGIPVPLKIELSQQDARGLINDIQSAINTVAGKGKAVAVPFTWEAKDAPKYTGDPIRIPWTYGDGPSGPPAGGSSGGPGPGPATPPAGSGSGRSRTSSRTSSSGSKTATPDEAAADKAAKDQARSERRAADQAAKTAREAERDSRQQQADQQQARTTGTATGSSGSGSTGRQTRAEKSAANKAAHAAARAEKRASQAAEKAALLAEREALKNAQSATSSPATPAASSAPAAASVYTARGGIGHPVGRQGFRKNYIAGGGRPRGIPRDRGPLPASVPRHGYTVADKQGMDEADAAMRGSAGTRTGLRVGEGWDVYVENIVGKQPDVDFNDPEAFTAYLRSMDEDSRKKFWKQYRTTGATSKRDPLGRIKDPAVHAAFMAVLQRQAERRQAEITQNPGAVNITAAAKGRSGVYSGGRQSMAGVGTPRGRSPKKEKLADSTVISGEDAPDIGSTASQMVWRDIRPEGFSKISDAEFQQKYAAAEAERTTPTKGGLFEWRGHKFVSREKLQEYIANHPEEMTTEATPLKKQSRKQRRAHLQSETPGTPPPPLNSLGVITAPEILPDQNPWMSVSQYDQRRAAKFKERRDARLLRDQDKRLGISRTGVPEDVMFGPAVPAGLMGKIDLPPQQTEEEQEAAHAASLIAHRKRRAEAASAAEATRGDIASRSLGSDQRTGVSPRVRMAGLVERGMRAKYGDVSPDMIETAVKSTLASGMPIEKVAKFWGIDKYAEGGLLHAADGLYSREIGHKFGAAAPRPKELKSYAYQKVRNAQIRKQPYCAHCGVGRVEARNLGLRLSVDAITSEAHGGDHWDPENLQTLCTSCNSRKSGFSHQPDQLWGHPRPSTLLGHPRLQAERSDFLPGGKLFGIATLRQALKLVTGKEKTEKKAEGGSVRHGGLLERMAQSGHEPSIKLLTKENSGLIPGVEWAERGPELGVSDPNTGETEIVPTHKVPQWLQRVREGRGFAKDLTGRAEGGGDLGSYGENVLRQAGIRRTRNNRYQNIADSRFVGADQVRTRVNAAMAGGQVQHVFVTNWPSSLTVGAGAHPAAAAAPARPAAAGVPPIAGAPASPAAAASPMAAATAAGGTGTGPQTVSSRFTSRDIGARMREARWGGRDPYVEMQSQVQQAKQMTPARAFTTSVAQMTEQISGRAGIQQRAKKAEQAISAASQAYNAEQSERAETTKLIHKARWLEQKKLAVAAGTAGQGAKWTDANEQELISLKQFEIREQRAVARRAHKATVRLGVEAQERTGDVLHRGDVAKNLMFGLGGLLGATIAMKTAFTALNTVVDASGEAVAKSAEMMLGFRNTAAEYGRTLGTAVLQQDGNTKAVVANSLALSGMNEKTAELITPALASRASTIAGNQAGQTRMEQVAGSGLFSQRPRGLPSGFDTNLVQGVGGPMGLPFGPGSTAPTAEVIQNVLGQIPVHPTEMASSLVPTGMQTTPDPLGWLSGVSQAYIPNAVKLGETLEYLNNQADAAGNTLKLVASSGDAVEKTAKAFEDIGAPQLASEIRAKQVALNGGDLTKFQTADWLKAQSTYAPTAGELAKSMERPIFAQRMDLFRQRELGLKQDIPAATAMQYIAQPQLPYGQRNLANGQPAGIKPSENLLPGVVSKEDFNAQVKAYSTAYSTGYAKEAVKSQKIITEEVERGRQVLSDWGVPDDMIADIESLGAGIQTITRGLEQRNLNLTTAQYTNQIRLAQRAWGDASDMAAAVAGHTKQTVGGLEGQNLALARQSQLLGFMLEQRQINYKLAMAGFTAPGDTPEARQARIDFAKKEAEYAQKQLNIQKQMGSNQYKVANLQIFRSMTDAAAEISLLKEARAIAIETAAKSDQIKAMNDAQALLIQQAQEYAKEGRGAVEIWNKATAEIEARTGKAFDRWMGKIIPGYTKAGEAFAAGIQAALVVPAAGNGGRNDGGNNGPGSRTSLPTVTPTTAAGRRETEDQRDYNGNGIIGAQTGFLGNVSRPTDFTVGEVANETVAVLRNPRSMPMAGGGGGGGVVNVNINITGGGEINEEKLARWAAQIQRATIEALNRKTSLLGLRVP